MTSWHVNFLDLLGFFKGWTNSLSLPPTVKFHDVFHVSLHEKYVRDVDHLIYWFLLQVELDGELHPEPQCILWRKVLMLWNREIE